MSHVVSNISLFYFFYCLECLDGEGDCPVLRVVLDDGAVVAHIAAFLFDSIDDSAGEYRLPVDDLS